MSEARTRRLIYCLLLLVIGLPLLSGWRLKPAPMHSSDKVFSLIESLPENPPDGYALAALDFGPGTQAENEPQAEAVLEHLFRRRIPIVVFTGYALGERFSIDTVQHVADALSRENPERPVIYGTDWISLGYKPGGPLFIQALSAAENLTGYLGKDVRGVPIASYERFRALRNLKNFIFAGEFTGLTGMLGSYIQFLQRSDYVPPLVHGCTSITIPEAYIYLDSGQLKGAFEGIAGAAWYGELLSGSYPGRAPGNAAVINTALGNAHLLIIALIIAGNLLSFLKRGQS